MKADPKSLVGVYKANPGIVFASVLGILSFVAMIGAAVYVQKEGAQDQRYLQQVAELRAQAYRLTSLSREATSGDEKAFGELAGVVSKMDNTWA
ncbi:MAG TPA: chemotaxis protein, partial [Cellvibrio sp.]